MNTPRFSITALLLIVMLFSVLGFFFTIYLVDMAYRPAINEYYPIADTEWGVRYSSVEPNGLCTGPAFSAELKLAGDFGHDWGAHMAGDQLYINEYTSTPLGMMRCDLVRVDLPTLHKTVLARNTILRGTCASGELVCQRHCLLPSNQPRQNSLCKLYGMSSSVLRPEDQSAEVVYLDPVTGEELYAVRDAHALDEDFDTRYLARTLSEVRP